MEINNPLYKNQGIHVISSIFTIDKGILKVLLIRRNNEPFKDKWGLVGGALYNKESALEGMKREIFEKTGLKNVSLSQYMVFSDVNRSPVMRMIALAYLGVVDIDKINVVKQTLKTKDADWFAIDNIPPLAYDHNEIIESAVLELQSRIKNTDILKSIYPKGFTLPELLKVYEAILKTPIDRRNFRKKMLNTGLIYDTKKTRKFEGNKPAKVYKFKINFKENNVF